MTPLAIFVPAYGMSSRFWRPAASLTSCESRLIELEGFDGSGHERRFDEHVATVVATAAAAEQPCVLVAHCASSKLALEAVSNVDCVAGAVLFCPNFAPVLPGPATVDAVMGAELLRAARWTRGRRRVVEVALRMARQGGSETPPSFLPPDMHEVTVMVGVDDATPIMRYYNAVVEYYEVATSTLPAPRVPVLIVVARDDEFVDREPVDAVAAAWGSPVTVVETADHFFPFRAPTLAAREIDEFVRGLA